MNIIETRVDPEVDKEVIPGALIGTEAPVGKEEEGMIETTAETEIVEDTTKVEVTVEVEGKAKKEEETDLMKL